MSGPVTYEALRDLVRAGVPVVLATVVAVDPPDGPAAPGAKLLVAGDGAPADTPAGSLGDTDLDRVVARDARGVLDAGGTALRHYGPRGEAGQEAVTVFLECFAPPPRLFVFGAVDFTAALVTVGRVLGYRVTVCDARATFATRARFPDADEVVVDWPHRFLAALAPPPGPRDAICVLTHDHRFDVPAIVAALDSEVGYLGAMGSRRTHAERLERLRAEGVGEEALARVMGPIGLDIGARTPEETAVAICAEIVALRTGCSGGPLRDTTGPIHP